ncbi:potassium channel family protein [Streptomyces sp. NRRL S-1022]|uniref:potassium channel family protein n=1 Tax=Streptomyces sp. NRRL S-1022 TaxID=1463880 RepID=UPI0004C22087|nr:potassium channel family protein [Streptomyces sp. NRRL S-1022]
MDDDSRTRYWERWQGRAALPLGIASLLYLAGYATHVLAADLPPASHDVLWAVMGASWAVFIVDYAVHWRLSGRGLGFVTRHWLDTLVMLLPLLWPLRIVRLYDVVQRRRGRARLRLHARVVLYAGLSALLLGFSGALAVYQQERGAPHATIRTFGDSLWWAASTLSTVGYGDVTPITPGGRTIAVGLMVCGLALLGAVTGSASSLFLQRFSLEEDEDRERPPGP